MDSSTKRRRRLGRTVAAAVAATALAWGGAVAAVPASAATAHAVTDAVFEWGFSKEAGGGAFAGGCNFLSAGIAGNTGSSRVWTEADGFYKATEGNVSILKDGPNSTRIAPTFATKCQTGAGTAVTPISAASATNNSVKITGGTGAVAADGSVTLAWNGDFSVVFYGGMTYWSASDPELTLDASGNGQITATASGYGTSMEDQTQWAPIAPREIVLADISAGAISDTGFTTTPAYLGVTVDTGSGSAQVTTGPNAGSFPQSFIDFQALTGQSSYWYSSGGSRDAAKPATPVSVSYSAPAAAPSVTVSKTAGLTVGETVTVTGSGFLPAGAATTGTRPPLAGQFVGAYVAFGKFADVWKPSENAPSSARATRPVTKWALPTESHANVGGANAGAIELKADGTFSVDITLSPTEAQDALAGNYGIYTYAGSGATYAPFETFTPLTFAHQTDVVVEIPEWVDNPTGSFGWAFAGTSPADLGTATQDGANFVATGSLTNITVTDTRSGGASPYTWSISGQASAFTSAGGGSFSAGLLGWTPKVVSGGASVTKGAGVTSTQLGGTGLGASRVLASSTAAASATVGADLSLVIPGTTAAGDYTSKLTITALQ